jgi:hypothetical protein
MGDDLPAFIELVYSLAGNDFARTVLEALGLTLMCAFAGGVTGLVLSVAVAGPALRWGLGRAGVWGCLAAVLLIVSGLLGFGWAGAWIGGGRAIVDLIDDRLVVEELALRAVVSSVSEGESLSVDELEMRLSAAFESSDQVIDEIVNDVRAELRAADPDLELDGLVPQGLLEEAVARVRAEGLAEPSMLARVWAVGGFRDARSHDDPEVRSYAARLLETTAPMRSEVGRMVHATVWPSALPGPVFGILLPLGLILLIAVFGRWWRTPEVV